MIAALFVAEGGCYIGLPDVDPWPESRDARRYAGPWPVVAHPPCARWSQLAGFCQSMGYGQRGADGGCFASALASVRAWGGVLEHPARSAAWKAHGIIAPGRGGWSSAGDGGGWTCEVDQGLYGHRARKSTWLYAYGVDLPSLQWGRAVGRMTLSTRPEARRRSRTGDVQRMGARERLATPAPFRDILLGIARTAHERSSTQ